MGRFIPSCLCAWRTDNRHPARARVRRGSLKRELLARWNLQSMRPLLWETARHLEGVKGPPYGLPIEEGSSPSFRDLDSPTLPRDIPSSAGILGHGRAERAANNPESNTKRNERGWLHKSLMDGSTQSVLFLLHCCPSCLPRTKLTKNLKPPTSYVCAEALPSWADDTTTAVPSA